MASSQGSQSSGGSSWSMQRSGSSQNRAGPRAFSRMVMSNKIDQLVAFMLYRYRRKELVSRAEMLYNFMKEYPEHFPATFSKASECLYRVFGVDVQELCPPGHIYALVPVLGLTYNMGAGDEFQLAKTGLLVMIITTIFRKGNRARERVIWLTLSRVHLFDGREHAIYGNPRRFITEELVQEGYLVYRQVPNRDPAQYEFLWGPRTHAETTKMKVLEHLARVNKRDPWSYPHLYEQAFREEIEATRARRAVRAADRVSCGPGVYCVQCRHH